MTVPMTLGFILVRVVDIVVVVITISCVGTVVTHEGRS